MRAAHGHTSPIAENRERREQFPCRFLSRSARAFVPLALAAALVIAGSDATAQSSKAGQTPAGNAENGKKVFARFGCYECHGREAQGGGLNGPRLAPNPVPLSVLQSYVRQPQGEMPPYTDKVVSDKDLADIYAFLQSQSQPPGVKTIPILKH